MIGDKMILSNIATLPKYYADQTKYDQRNWISVNKINVYIKQFLMMKSANGVWTEPVWLLVNYNGLA